MAKLPVDIVKVDKSFTQDRPAGPRPGWAFTNAILQLVESLDLVAVVEGVETAEQADALRARCAARWCRASTSPGRRRRRTISRRLCHRPGPRPR